MDIQCTKCGNTKNEEKFRKRNGTRTGYQYWCKDCEAIGNKKRYKATKALKPKKIRIPKTKEEIAYRAKERMLKYRYGLTMEQYNSMYTGKCEICEKPYDLGGYNGLCVDHDHHTGDVRGLLCSSCNTFLGKYENNPHIIDNMKSYLKL
jgi:hypothetical protein